MDRYDALADLCARRGSVRAFSDEELTDGEIERIRAVARTAPYASGKKNWELIVVTDRAVIGELAGIVRRRCGGLAERVRGGFGEGFLRYAENFLAFESAPALFIPAFRVPHSISLLLDGGDQAEIAAWERDSYVKSISCVAMLVLLAAESLGLGACYMTGPLVAQAEIAERVGARNGYEIGALIPVGRRRGENS